MELSLGVPTATSVRVVPAKLLEVNRRILNNHLGRTRGGKVSFTHLIGYAVVRAAGKMPVMNSSFVDGEPPRVVTHKKLGLGLAVDQTKSDGSHTLLVPVHQRRQPPRLPRLLAGVRGPDPQGAYRARSRPTISPASP